MSDLPQQHSSQQQYNGRGICVQCTGGDSEEIIMICAICGKKIGDTSALYLTLEGFQICIDCANPKYITTSNATDYEYCVALQEQDADYVHTFVNIR